MKGKYHKLVMIIITLAFVTPLFGFSNAVAEITLTYSDWQLGEDIWGRSLREAMAEFERLNPGIKVKTEPVALGQRDVKFTTAIRGGKGPDVFALDANPVKQYIKNKWVKDLTPFIKKEGGQEWLSDFYPVTLMPVTEKDGIYGIPKNVVAMVLVYNSDLLNQSGISSPPKSHRLSMWLSMVFLFSFSDIRLWTKGSNIAIICLPYSMFSVTPFYRLGHS